MSDLLFSIEPDQRVFATLLIRFYISVFISSGLHPVDVPQSVNCTLQDAEPTSVDGSTSIPSSGAAE